jgi:EamA-like transporter family
MMLLLLASALSWAVGSVYSQRRAAHIPSDQLAGMQLICGGGGLLILSTIAGEWTGFALANVTVTSIAGMLYLALLGSVVGNTVAKRRRSRQQPSTFGGSPTDNPDRHKRSLAHFCVRAVLLRQSLYLLAVLNRSPQ